MRNVGVVLAVMCGIALGSIQWAKAGPADSQRLLDQLIDPLRPIVITEPPTR